MLKDRALDGLWKATFHTDAFTGGGGVVVIDGRKIRGGDFGYYYVGEVAIEGGRAIATIDVIRWEPPVGMSVYGPLRQFRLRVSGNIEPRAFSLGGHIEGDPRTPAIVVEVERLAD